MRSLHKFQPKHRSKINRTLDNKTQSLYRTNLQSNGTGSHFLRRGHPIPVYLLYKKEKFVIKTYFGMPYEKLFTQLYHEIICWEIKQTGSQEIAKKQAKKVIGFNTTSGDLKVDYLLSIKKGIISKSLLLECFMFSKKQNRVLNYVIYNCLAIGGFSKVYLARSRENGRFYAIKFIKKKKNEFEASNENSILNEIKIGNEVSHPFLIEMRESFETEGFFCMVFQYCPGGELFFLLKRIKIMKEEQARFFFIQILLAFDYLHHKFILYRDLKPENILIDHEGNAKIVDFGLSKVVGSSREKTFSYCGSAEYMAPEMIMRCGHNLSIDYYSLGALLYELVTGLPPFYTKDPEELESSIVYERLGFPSHINLSAEVKDILLKLLEKDFRFRLGSFAGVKEIMAHPWILKFKKQEYLNKNIIPPFIPNLSEHNFDVNQLGDDEQEFTEQVYTEFCRSTKSKPKIHFSPREVSQHFCGEVIDQIISQLREERKESKNKGKEKDKDQKENEISFIPRKVKVSTIDKGSTSKLNTSLRKKQTLTFSERSENNIRNSSKQSRMRAKLLPYFVKNKIQKVKVQEKENKKLPRTNILKVRIFHNHMNSQNNH